jgi:hypothetical protein|tara:strand:- start:507 stop:635 length:129 start_codon:yes stop_codon:yes gene_type:complete
MDYENSLGLEKIKNDDVTLKCSSSEQKFLVVVDLDVLVVALV